MVLLTAIFKIKLFKSSLVYRFPGNKIGLTSTRRISLAITPLKNKSNQEGNYLERIATWYNCSDLLTCNISDHFKNTFLS